MPTLKEAQADYERACKDCDAAEALVEAALKTLHAAIRARSRAAARLSDAQIALDAAKALEESK